MAISKKPKQLLNLDIQDEVIRANFDTLNRELQKRQGNKEAEPPNVVYSAPGSFTNLQSASAFTLRQYLELPWLTVTIKTRGNPVNLKLISRVGSSDFAEGGIISLYPRLLGSARTEMDMAFGYFRQSPGNAREVMNVQLYSYEQPTATVLGMHVTIPLPAFEIEDPVPSGTWTYSFFARCENTHTALKMSQILLCAKEQA